MDTGNAYCDAIGIVVPSVEMVVQSRGASGYGLLLTVLLERGGPVTLEEAARRMAAAGAGDARTVLESLKRCRPGRPPMYRNGEYYALDPHDEEAGFWAFRLGLKPPRTLLPSAAQPKVEQEPVLRQNAILVDSVDFPADCT